jgi:hypothetical protein
MHLKTVSSISSWYNSSRTRHLLMRKLCLHNIKFGTFCACWTRWRLRNTGIQKVTQWGCLRLFCKAKSDVCPSVRVSKRNNSIPTKSDVSPSVLMSKRNNSIPKRRTSWNLIRIPNKICRHFSISVKKTGKRRYFTSKPNYIYWIGDGLFAVRYRLRLRKNLWSQNLVFYGEKYGK